MSGTAVETTIADDAYVQVQGIVELLSRLLLDPKSGLGKPSLDLFIERADRSLAVGPILHPSEFQAGAEKLQEVLAYARALKTARDAIEKASSRSAEDAA
jgi:hypothetical protein